MTDQSNLNLLVSMAEFTPWFQIMLVINTFAVALGIGFIFKEIKKLNKFQYDVYNKIDHLKARLHLQEHGMRARQHE